MMKIGCPNSRIFALSRSAKLCSTDALYSAPLGLFGELMMTAFVCGVMEASIAAISI